MLYSCTNCYKQFYVYTTTFWPPRCNACSTCFNCGSSSRYHFGSFSSCQECFYRLDRLRADINWIFQRKKQS